jgi:hypothetical protein
MIWLFVAPGTHKGMLGSLVKAPFDLVEGARLEYVCMVLKQ